VLAAAIFYYLTHKQYLLIAAIVLASIGVFIPFIAEKIHWFWMKLAHVMGAVMSKVLLTIVYVVVVVPIAMIARAFGSKNSIRLKNDKQSYFVVRNVTYVKDSMENVW
jgi:hypothetical protein